MADTQPLEGVVVGMDEGTYHSRRELSSTEARMILRTPAEYRWHKDHPPLVAPSKKFDIGSAIHAKVLGTGYEVDVIPDDILATNGAASTTAAKAFIAASRDAGRIPMKAADLAAIDGPAEAVLANPDARQIFSQPGNAEVSVFATDPLSGVDVRARFDFLPNVSDGRLITADLKSTIDPSKRAFEAAVARYEYAVQRAWYLDPVKWVLGDQLDGREPEMVFVAVGKEPPYLTAVYQLPTIWAQKGHLLAAKARRVYAECVKDNEWPGLPRGVQFLDEPTWHVYQLEEEHHDI